MSRKIIGLFVCLVLLTIFIPLLGADYQAIPRILPLGWAHFLSRNWSQLQWNWGLIITGLLCSVVIVIGLQWSFTKLFEYLRGVGVAEIPPRWRWRWTLGCYAALWLLFLIAFGAIGTYRHAGWLFELPKPWYEPRWRADELVQLGHELELISRVNEQRVTAIRESLRHEPSRRVRGRLLEEDFDFVLFASPTNTLTAYAVVPRYPKGTNPLFLVSTNLTDVQTKPISEAPRILAALESAPSSPVSGN